MLSQYLSVCMFHFYILFIFINQCQALSLYDFSWIKMLSLSLKYEVYILLLEARLNPFHYMYQFLCCITHCQKSDTWNNISSLSVFRSGIQILCSGPHNLVICWLGCLFLFFFWNLRSFSKLIWLLIEFISLLLYPLRAPLVALSS